MDLRKDITKPMPDREPAFCLHKSLGPHICCCFTSFLWRSVKTESEWQFPRYSHLVLSQHQYLPWQMLHFIPSSCYQNN